MLRQHLACPVISTSYVVSRFLRACRNCDGTTVLRLFVLLLAFFMFFALLLRVGVAPVRARHPCNYAWRA